MLCKQSVACTELNWIIIVSTYKAENANYCHGNTELRTFPDSAALLFAICLRGFSGPPRTFKVTRHILQKEVSGIHLGENPFPDQKSIIEGTRSRNFTVV